MMMMEMMMEMEIKMGWVGRRERERGVYLRLRIQEFYKALLIRFAGRGGVRDWLVGWLLDWVGGERREEEEYQ